MTFSRSLLREMTVWAGFLFSALFAITVTTHLIRYLGQAASGRIASEAVVALLGFSAIGYIPVLLSLTAFVAVLMTLSRAFRDSEMVIWFGAGLPLSAWIRPVLIFAVPLVVTIAVLSFFLAPWATSQSNRYREQLKAQEELSRIMPGTFRESANAERVYFVEAVDGDESSVQNIFISSTQNQRAGVMISKRGFEQLAPNGDRYLVLLNGRRYEGTPGLPEYRIMDFERYAIRVEARDPSASLLPPKAKSTRELLTQGDNAARGELLWRIGVPVSALLLSLLAVPMAYVNPRSGRSANLLLALVVYMIYSNLLSVSQAWVAQGRIGFVPGLLMVHLAMAVVAASWFHRRMRIPRPSRLRPA